MLRKTCTLADFKMTEEGSGSFSGYASTHSNKDLAGEIVCKGAFDKHLEKFLVEGFGAVGHDWQGLPVATPKAAREDAKGLFTEFDFHSTEEAQKARTYVRERLERGKSVGLSIGYTVKDQERTKEALLLKEIELLDHLTPQNPKAKSCVAIEDLGNANHCIFVNEDGKYHMHMLEGCTAAMAHEYVKQHMSQIVGARLVFTGEKADKAGEN